MGSCGKKILVVDDERFFCHAMEKYFSRMGFKVLLAYDGESALEIARKEKPFVVTLDYLMPGLNGPEVLREFKKLDDTLPVLVISASGDPEREKKLEEMGALKVMGKPVDLKELGSIILGIEKGRA